MLPVSTKETTYGYFVSRDYGSYGYDLGVRADEISRSGSVAHHDDDHADEAGEVENFDKDLSTLSVAFNFDQDFSDNLNVNLGLSRFERAPDVVELFMNGPHLATGRFEVGNPNLDTEISSNVDITFDSVSYTHLTLPTS